MVDRSQVVTAAEMDEMSPQQRADVIDNSVQQGWPTVDTSFRERVERRARRLARILHADA